LTVVGANIKTLQVQNDQVRKHWLGSCLLKSLVFYFFRKVLELEEELKVIGNNMKTLEISENEVYATTIDTWCMVFAACGA
jgi:hypothetical protein